VRQGIERRTLATDDCSYEGVVLGHVLEDLGTHDELPQHHAEAVDVDLGGDAAAGERLRSHVERLSKPSSLKSVT